MQMNEEQELLEVSDLIVAYDAQTLERQPVSWASVEDYYQQRKARAALRVVRGLHRVGDTLDPVSVDRALVLSHIELQRLEEEFLHGQRVLDLIRAVVLACERAGVPKPFRIVDVGCGLGYVVRWLTSFGGLGADVELVGVDYNATFIKMARRLAEQEGLRSKFAVSNAFQLQPPATIYLSSGVLHHFRGAGLNDFLRQQVGPETMGFVHTDILPSPLTPLGAWIYHAARMRQPLARHDGPLSARRAHSAATLLAAAETACPEMVCQVCNPGSFPLVNVFQSLVGIRPELAARFEQAREIAPLCYV